MKVLIRVDASSQVGTGHLMRCLALAQAWKDAGGQVIFITACQSEGSLQRLREEGFDIHLLAHPYPDPGDWNYTKDILAAHPDAWVVLDGYHFDEVYQRQVREAGNRLLVIDDMAHLKHYYADIVLNQNLHAEELHYSCEPDTHLLLGTEYVLIRKEFLQAKETSIRLFPDRARNILISFGGLDSKNLTLKVLQAIDTLNDPEIVVRVVAGDLNPHIEVLRHFVSESSSDSEILVGIKHEMPELMAWADLAVTATGSTIWELCLLKVPTIAAVLVDNQKDVASALSDIGAVRNAGWLVETGIQELADDIDQCIQDSALRKSMSDSMAQVVDGKGVERIVSFIGG